MVIAKEGTKRTPRKNKGMLDTTIRDDVSIRHLNQKQTPWGDLAQSKL
jgi:hypothetical protein